MPWRVQLDAQRRTIHVGYVGHVSIADVRECAGAVIEIMKRDGVGSVMTDFSAATQVDASTTDIVSLPQLFKALGLDRSYREALVAPLGCAALEQAEIYETVCLNRGIPVRVFRDRDAAQQWLGAP